MIPFATSPRGSPATWTMMATAAVVGGATAVGLVRVLWQWKARDDNGGDGLSIPNTIRNATAHEQLIWRGTPMVKLQIVSKILGRNIYCKMESLNPGGTGKDRAALSMIRHAENEGLLPPPVVDPLNQAPPYAASAYDLHLHPESIPISTETSESPSNNTKGNKTAKNTKEIMEKMVWQAIQTSRSGGLVVEGTSGSTGIALATLCQARGHACLVVLPDDQAKEKQTILRSLGAVVYEVPTAAISNPQHYVNLARKAAILAKEEFGTLAVFTDQFENEANYDMHYHRTGPEIWAQRKGKINAFVMSSGTGGTLAGVGTYLKEQSESHVEIVLVDPPGSALYHKVEHGVAYALEQRERTLRKHRYDTLAEGIGLDRVTHNFSLGLESMDRAIRVTDQEAVDMAHWILKTEGLWVGSSSAMNLVGAVRVALDLPRGSHVVTMICDAGQRHATRFWNPVFIEDWGLVWPARDCIPECLRGLIPKNR